MHSDIQYPRPLFAVKHLPSGMFLPESKGNYTLAQLHDGLPRIFQSRHNANVALTFWLKGVHDVRDHDDGTRTVDIYEEGDRKAEDMRVVELFFYEKKPYLKNN